MIAKKTYSQVVYAGHNQAVIGMDYMRSGRYRRDGVKHCWNLVYDGKLSVRDGQALDMAAYKTVLWGHPTDHHTNFGGGGAVFSLPRGVSESFSYAKPFDLDDISGAVMKLDAEDDDTFEMHEGTDDQVYFWTDSVRGYVFKGREDPPEWTIPTLVSNTPTGMGQAVRFDGTTQFQLWPYTGSHEDIAAAMPYTVMIIGELSELGQTQYLFNATSEARAIVSATGRFGIRGYTTGFYADEAVAPVPKRFMMLGVFNGDSSSVYVLGETKVGTTGGSRVIEAEGFRIGAYNTTSGYPFYGYLKEFRIWNRELSADELLTLKILTEREYGI